MDIESDASVSMQQSPSPPREPSPSPIYSPRSSVPPLPQPGIREISIPYSPPPPSLEPDRVIKIEPRDPLIPPANILPPSLPPSQQSVPQASPQSQTAEITVLPPLHITSDLTIQALSHGLPPKPTMSSLPSASSRTTATSMATPLGRRFSLQRQYSAQIRIRGDPGIRGIVFSQAGTEFAVLCTFNTLR